MPSSWNVHTLVPANGYVVTAESAPVFEADNMLATVTLPVVFRGTRENLLDKFPFGAQNCPQGGSGANGGMFCLGLQDARQIAHTADDPHWDAQVAWAGIHNEISASGAKSAFSVVSEWTTRETSFPITVQPSGGGDPIYATPGPPVTPNGEGPAGLWKGRRIDHIPARTATGVILSNTEPSPVSADIKTLVTAFPDPPAGLIYNYGPLLADPVFVTFPGQDAPDLNNNLAAAQGEWLCRNFKILRKISAVGAGYAAAALYFVSATWTWEQLRQPS